MSVRIAAVFALGEIGDPAAVPVLITVLRNGEKDRTTLDLRFWATQTLEKIGTPEAMKAVKEHGVWMQDEAIDQG
jgi:HEAT repeat protein